MIKLFFLSLMISVNSYAWGPVGHKTVCQIAEDNLNQKAKEAAAELLGGKSLAEHCMWADEVKKSKEYGFSETWHYATVPTGQTYQSSKKNPDGDVVEAISRMEEILASSRPKKEKAVALRFLIHFVGDIHQPLHVGREDDRGANNCHVGWFGHAVNLHSVWDSKILERQGLEYPALAKKLEQRISSQEISQWQNSDNLGWAAESMQIREQTVYPPAKDGKALCSANPELDKDKKPTNVPQLDQRYYERNIEVVNARLAQGGVRLAGVLNKIFR